jgi:hypothetical protein
MGLPLEGADLRDFHGRRKRGLGLTHDTAGSVASMCYDNAVK